VKRPPTEERSDAEPPGLLGCRTWRGLYLIVLGWFVLLVVLFAAFSRFYS
jgi:hypothetical protein